MSSLNLLKWSSSITVTLVSSTGYLKSLRGHLFLQDLSSGIVNKRRYQRVIVRYESKLCETFRIFCVSIVGIIVSFAGCLYYWQYRSGKRCFSHNTKSVLGNFCKYLLFQCRQAILKKYWLAQWLQKSYGVVHERILLEKEFETATRTRACRMGTNNTVAFDLHLQRALLYRMKDQV